jgi:hypothetical protein
MIFPDQRCQCWFYIKEVLRREIQGLKV